MSNFDVAICLDQKGVSSVVASLYARPSLRAKLFTRTETMAVGPLTVTASWDVRQAPQVQLTPPTADQWKSAIKKDGTTPQPESNAFVVHFPEVAITRQSSEGNKDATISIDAICTAEIANSLLRITPVAAVVPDLASASALDRQIYTLLIVPRVLTMTGDLLAAEKLPNIAFQGVQFGAPVLVVGGGTLAAVANLANKPTPAAPSLGGLPTGGFCVLLSPEAMQLVTSQGAKGLQGHKTGSSGSKDFGIGTARYDAQVSLDQVSATVRPDNLTVVNASVRVSASASATVDVLGEVWNQITNAANVVAGGVTTAANAVADTATTVGNAIANTFSSY